MSKLLAVVLWCAAGVEAADCTRDTAVDVVVSQASTPIDCLKGGQHKAALNLAPLPGGVIVFRCERRKG